MSFIIFLYEIYMYTTEFLYKQACSFRYLYTSSMEEWMLLLLLLLLLLLSLPIFLKRNSFPLSYSRSDSSLKRHNILRLKCYKEHYFGMLDSPVPSLFKTAQG
jgi:hypothetical protein